jgi:hypothetical protein
MVPCTLPTFLHAHSSCSITDLQKALRTIPTQPPTRPFLTWVLRTAQRLAACEASNPIALHDILGLPSHLPTFLPSLTFSLCYHLIAKNSCKLRSAQILQGGKGGDQSRSRQPARQTGHVRASRASQTMSKQVDHLPIRKSQPRFMGYEISRISASACLSASGINCPSIAPFSSPLSSLALSFFLRAGPRNLFPFNVYHDAHFMS